MTACLMLATMTSKLQKQHKNMEDYNMIEHLKNMFYSQARHENYDISKVFFGYKMVEKDSIAPHVLNMMKYIEFLKRLKCPLGKELSVDPILSKSYSQFLIITIRMNLTRLCQSYLACCLLLN